MRWPWQRRALRPTIPPYQVPVSKRETPKTRGIEVEEIKPPPGMTETGVFKAWKRGEKTVSGSCPDVANSDHLTPDQPSEQPPKTPI